MKMSRLIDLDKLLNNKKYTFQTKGGAFSQHDWFMKLDDILHAKVIEAKSVEEAWVPVSKRLPEKDGDSYLVTLYSKMAEDKKLGIAHCFMNRDGFWGNIPFGYEVIAWMPLPKAYEL